MYVDYAIMDYGVSTNGGTPKWMIHKGKYGKIMENPTKMDDDSMTGGTTILGNHHMSRIMDYAICGMTCESSYNWATP